MIRLVIFPSEGGEIPPIFLWYNLLATDPLHSGVGGAKKGIYCLFVFFFKSVSYGQIHPLFSSRPISIMSSCTS